MFKYKHYAHLRGNDGDAWKFEFPNGYRASVARNSRSDGGKDGFFELAVMTSKGKFIYPAPIFVANHQYPHGWLTIERVNAILDRVAAMPAASVQSSSGGRKK